MFAPTHTSLDETRPTALVVVKALIAEITSVPGCSESTSPTTPSNGARTTVWSSWRWASVTADSAHIGCLLFGRDVGIAVELRQDLLRLVLQRADHRLGSQKRAAGGVDLRAG